MIKKGLVVLLVIVISGCTVGPPALSPQQDKEKQGVIQKNNKITLRGKVYPFRDVGVISPLSGKIQEITVKLDDYIEKGMPLVYFDTTQLNSELLTARARLAKSRTEMETVRNTYREDVRLGISKKEAKVRLQEAEFIFDNITQKLKRTREAHKEGAVSNQELEVVENEYVRANAELKVAQLRATGLPEEKRIITSCEADVRANQTEYIRAFDRLEESTIKALISGFITEIAIYKGQKVYEGWKLMTIVDISQVIVKAKISPGLLRFVHSGQDVEVVINTVPPTNLSSKIDSIRKVADLEDQMCELSVVLANKDFTIQPGFSATVEIATTKEK